MLSTILFLAYAIPTVALLTMAIVYAKDCFTYIAEAADRGECNLIDLMPTFADYLIFASLIFCPFFNLITFGFCLININDLGDLILEQVEIAIRESRREP